MSGSPLCQEKNPQLYLKVISKFLSLGNPFSSVVSGLREKRIVLFYATCIRSIQVYAVPVFFYALPKYLQCELERVQNRALSIICPSLSYDEALNEAGIPTIISYREDICDEVLNAALGNNKLNKLLTKANKAPYLLRKSPTLCTSKVEDGPF